jgi:L-threonylcarbamoyladenylate synthase
MLPLAIQMLNKGGIVVCPTETVYGIFADASCDEAVKEVYRVKGRPAINPLIVHVSSLSMAMEIARFDQDAIALATFFWDEKKAPLTLVLPMKKEAKISKYVTAGVQTIAIRKPQHDVAISLIESFGKPLAAPSANRSGSVSPTSYEMVMQDIGKYVRLVIDGGPCSVGLESTIVSLISKPYRVLRPGFVGIEEIEAMLPGQSCKYSNNPSSESTVLEAPGLMKKHYSPVLPVRINAEYPHNREAFLGFGQYFFAVDANLSERGSLEEAARNLFFLLKKLDQPEKYVGIAVAPIPYIGAGRAINDRLTRASAT